MRTMRSRRIAGKTASRAALAVGLVLSCGGWAAAQEEDPERQKLLRKLETTRLTVAFENTALEDAIGFLRDACAMNIVIDATAYDSHSMDDLRVTLKVRELRVKSILKLMLEMKDLTAVYDEGVLLIVPENSTLHNRVTTQVYDVRDLLFKIRDFPGPTVELAAPSAGSGVLGATFSLGDEEKSTITEEFLEDLVRQNTGGSSWEENDQSSLALTNGLLIITQTAKVHAEVRRLLQLLRQYK